MAVNSEQALLESALDALQCATHTAVNASLHMRKPASGRREPDAEIDLSYAGKAYSFGCEVKAKLSLETLPAIAAQVETLARSSDTPVVLITDYVSPRLADALTKQGIQFLDTAGNAYLAQKGLYIAIRGRPRKRGNSASAKFSWSRGALPIIHRLLNEPDALSMPYRDLAAISTVSVGTVHNTLDELKQRGFLRTIGKRLRLVERSELFDQWVTSYPQYLRGRLARRRLVIPGTHTLSEVAEQKRPVLGEMDWVIGGEGAAWLMDGYLRPEVLTLYGNGDLDVLCRALDARPAADGPIEVMQAFWTGHTSPGGEWGLADPILVYADLVYSRDPRAMEAAIRIRDGHIRLEATAG